MLSLVQITIVGDFDPKDLEETFRKYFGTLAPRAELLPLPHAPVHFVTDKPLAQRHQVRLRGTKLGFFGG
jgi:predicted Zn-dependent peptidase